MNVPGKWIAAALLLAVGGTLAWNRLTKPLGDQQVAFTPATVETGSDGRLRYAIYRAAGGVNGDVLYHLPGRNLDEKVWNDDTYFTAMLQAAWAAQQAKPPTVVEVSYGPVWLLAPRGEAADSGLLEDLLAGMDRIEARIGKPERRLLLGESMGGLNVLILGLRQPQRFARVASLSPGVYRDSPFSPFPTLKAALRRTGADPRTALGILALARRFVKSDREWDAISPLSLLESAGPGSPKFYLSCGLYDKFGNFEGCSLLAERARQRGMALEWHPMYGGHGAMDIKSLADFLVAR